MNIYVAILVLKMEENTRHFWHIMLYCFKKGKTTTEMQKIKRLVLCMQEGAVNDQMCQKWFVMFQAGDFLLNDCPWLGRPDEIDSNQINSLIENNQHYTMQELAEILKISK